MHTTTYLVRTARKGADSDYLMRISMVLGFLIGFVILIVFFVTAATNFNLCSIIDGVNAAVHDIIPVFNPSIPCPDFLGG